jgi:Protein of unknown function (DUF664)
MDKPDRRLDDPKQVLLGFLDYYRHTVLDKVAGLDGEALRRRPLPSGWTPIELVKHLTYMERRWFQWGFRAAPMPDAHGDEDAAGRWHVRPEESLDDIIAALLAGGRLTRSTVEAAELSDVAALGGRFGEGDRHPPPTLAWILAYVLQEYARHAGHLDVARELIDGVTGE